MNKNMNLYCLIFWLVHKSWSTSTFHERLWFHGFMLACIFFLEFNLKVVFNVYQKVSYFVLGQQIWMSNRTVKTQHFVEFSYNVGQEYVFGSFSEITCVFKCMLKCMLKIYEAGIRKIILSHHCDIWVGLWEFKVKFKVENIIV